jgi:hypothetical protein
MCILWVQSCWKKFKDILMNGLECSEYMFIRSAMIVLSKVALEYPVLQSLGQPLLQRIQQIENSEDGRGDIKLMAKSLASILRKQSSRWKVIDDGSKSGKNSKGSSTVPAASKSSDRLGSSAGESKARQTETSKGSDKQKDKEKEKERDSKPKDKGTADPTSGNSETSGDKKRKANEDIDNRDSNSRDGQKSRDAGTAGSQSSSGQSISGRESSKRGRGNSLSNDSEDSKQRDSAGDGKAKPTTNDGKVTNQNSRGGRGIAADTSVPSASSASSSDNARKDTEYADNNRNQDKSKSNNAPDTKG